MVGDHDEGKLTALDDVECCRAMRMYGAWISRVAWSMEKRASGTADQKRMVEEKYGLIHQELTVAEDRAKELMTAELQAAEDKVRVADKLREDLQAAEERIKQLESSKLTLEGKERELSTARVEQLQLDLETAQEEKK